MSIYDINSNFLVKNISIHSEDVQNKSSFYIDLPENISNIKSIRITDVCVPTLITFSKTYKNISVKFNIVFSNNNDEFIKPSEHSFSITEGNYSANQLVMELQNQMNSSVSSVYDGFKVYYNEVNHSIHFVNVHKHYFYFVEESPLLTRLGIGQRHAQNEFFNTNREFMYMNDDENPIKQLINNGIMEGYVLKSEKRINIIQPEVFYVEVDQFNSMDELVPNQKRAYRIDGALAKVNTNQHDNKIRTQMINETMLKGIVKRIHRLNVKLRFHNGDLVDFRGQPFSFTIGIIHVKT